MHTNTTKITRILLKNFSALTTSTGLETIEINRFDSKNKMVFILGANGSGKSSLIQEITPLPLESVRFRNSNRIIPGKDGVKELDILLNDQILYTCKIIYSALKKTSCFMTKKDLFTGEESELNPSGNVTSYLDVLEQELGVNKNYTNIGYISNTVTSIIEMSATERNNYLNLWLPDLTEYLTSYKTTQKKYNIYKKELDSVNNELGNLYDDNFKTKIKQLTSSLQDREESLEYYNKVIFTGETYLNSSNYVRIDDLYSEIKNFKMLFKDIDTEYTSIKQTLDLLAKYSTSKDIKMLKHDIEFKKRELATLQERLTNINTNITNYRNIIDEYAAKMNRSIGGDNLIDITNSLVNIEEDVNSIIVYVNDFIKNHNMTIKDLENPLVFQKSIYMIEECIRIVKSIESKIPLHDLYDGGIGKISNLEIEYNSSAGELYSVTEDITRLTKRLYMLKNGGIDEDVIKLKPDVCNISTCGLLRELYTYLEPSREVDKIENELGALEMKKMTIVSTIEGITDSKYKLNEAIHLLQEVNNVLHRNAEVIAKLPQVLLRMINTENVYNFLKDAETIKASLHEYENISTSCSRLTELTNQQDKLVNIQKLLILESSMEKEYNAINDKLTTEINNKREAFSQYNTLEESIKMLQSIDDNIENTSVIVQKYNNKASSLQTIKNSLTSKINYWYYMSHAKDIVFRKKSEKNSILKDISDIRTQIENYTVRLYSKERLEKKRDDILVKMKIYDVLLKTWSPRIGYPSLIIESFLNNIKNITNDDLKQVWENSLQIKEFVITNSEFSIIVTKNDVEVGDASNCSNAERAILAMAISIAIIEYNSKLLKYNIIRFDEADASLDATRRRFFLDIIIERLNKIGCQNSFIITHNNEFDNVEADVILLPGYELISGSLNNKSVIFKC